MEPDAHELLEAVHTDHDALVFEMRAVPFPRFLDVLIGGMDELAQPYEDLALPFGLGGDVVIDAFLCLQHSALKWGDQTNTVGPGLNAVIGSGSPSGFFQNGGVALAHAHAHGAQRETLVPLVQLDRGGLQ